MSDDKTKARIFPSAADDAKVARAGAASTAQLASPSYVLAYDDLDFILRDEMRPVRLMLELAKPEMILDEHKIENTVVVFGSARKMNGDDASERHRHYYEQARDLARRITEMSSAGAMANITVATGGGPGIMEAANRGAHEAGGKSIGFNIVLPKEQKPNEYITPELCFRFHYFAMRKMHFLMRARALVVFPGGFGTLDELLECLTLIQTKKIKPLPVIMFGREYWKQVLNLDFLVAEGMIEQADADIISYVENVEEAIDIISRNVNGHRAPR